MDNQLTEFVAATRLAIAALVGLGVGIEREWSAHVTGREPRFAGMRTLLMLGILGGVAGLLIAQGHEYVATALAAGGAALAVGAYVVAARRAGGSVDGTTEAAALLVIALGAIAGLGWIALAAASASVVVLALSEKKLLHGMVQHVHEEELRAALRFGVLALVVLPLLPATAHIGSVEIEPRALWMIVLFFCALNFAGFVARRAIGAARGYGVVGMLGGLISSTAVTLDFSRKSRREPALGSSFAHGVVGACTVLIPRVLVVSGALNPRVTLALLPLLAPPLVLGLLLVWRDWRRTTPGTEPATARLTDERSPLRLGLAIQMAVAFQVSMVLIEWARTAFATPGVYATAVALGLTDMDALTVGMSRSAAEITVAVAARAIAAGLLTNTIFKLGVAVSVGDRRFGRAAGAGLAGMAVASGLGLWLF